MRAAAVRYRLEAERALRFLEKGTVWIAWTARTAQTVRIVRIVRIVRTVRTALTVRTVRTVWTERFPVLPMGRAIFEAERLP